MEPEGLLPHSQVPANCPYPEVNYDYCITQHFCAVAPSLLLVQAVLILAQLSRYFWYT